MKEWIKKTLVYSILINIYTAINENRIKTITQRNKLFPGKVKLVDLHNARYISRKPIYDFLVSHADMLQGEVLDFGCGSMEYRSILKNAAKYVGLDIEGAEENGFIGKGEVTYYDGVNIPFANERFDSVMAIEVFEHVELLAYVLGELNRVMIRGGVLVFTVPMNFPLHLEPWDYRRFTKHGIINLLQKTGFEVIEIKASTTFKNTLRRLHILEAKSSKSKFFKIKVLMNNIGFALSNNVTDDEKMPVNWLVVCRKAY